MTKDTTMMRIWTKLCLTLVFVLASIRLASAGEPLADAELQRLLRLLESPRYSQRMRATEDLVTAGEQVVEEISQLAAKGRPETAARCVDVLNQLMRGANASAKQHAQSALEQLASADLVTTKRLALAALGRSEPEESLDDPELLVSGDDELLEPEPNPIRLGLRGAAQIRFNFRINGNGVQRVTTKIVNGQKQLEIVRPDKQIRIEEAAAGPIRVTVTETSNGKRTTTQFTVPNRDQLKQKHIEIYRLYSQHMPAAVQAEADPFPQNATPPQEPRLAPAEAEPAATDPPAKNDAADS